MSPLGKWIEIIYWKKKQKTTVTDFYEKYPEFHKKSIFAKK